MARVPLPSPPFHSTACSSVDSESLSELHPVILIPVIQSGRENFDTCKTIPTTTPHPIALSTGLINGRWDDPAPTPVSGVRMKTPKHVADVEAPAPDNAQQLLWVLGLNANPRRFTTGITQCIMEPDHTKTPSRVKRHCVFAPVQRGGRRLSCLQGPAAVARCGPSLKV